MINNLEDLALAIGGDDEEKPVTNEIRNAWNDYTNWLDKRGMKGHPSLDKNNLGKNMLTKYIKENPSSPLTLDWVIPIQKDFSNYRQWVINNIKSGKGEYGLGTNEENFMKELSIIDNYPGQYTTRHQFPREYLQTFEDGNLVSTEDKGFSTVK